MGYSRILVGTDGSATADKAVETAATLARQLGAELHILSAYRPIMPVLGSAAGVVVSPDVSDDLVLEASQEIADQAGAQWGQDLKVETHVMGGAAADAIVETAASIEADLIVVGNKGMKGARRVLGSVPNSVAHRAECAVLIVKTD